MKTLWQTLFRKLTFTLRERVHLALTTMALRHQLAVLRRSAKRPVVYVYTTDNSICPKTK
jgi:hypothetical protein